MLKFLLALQFLTRIQIKKDLIVDDETFGKSMAYFPLVGLVMGVILLLGYHCFSFLFTPLIVAALLIWLEVALSGALHLDGFMDTMDGIFSGRSRERILEIMRDSRVGAHSAISLACLFLLKLTVLTDLSTEQITYALLLAPLLGRLTQVINVSFFPYARETGLAQGFNQYMDKKDLYFALGSAFLVCIFLASWQGLIYFALACLTSWVLATYIAGKIGGLTGDVYGAISEITEMVIFFTAYLLGRI